MPHLDDRPPGMLKGLQARSHVLCAFFGPVQTAFSPRADVVVLVVCGQVAGNSKGYRESIQYLYKQRESDRRSPGRLLSNKCRTASIVRTGGLTGWSRLTDGPSRSDFGFQGFCSESSVGRHGRRRGRLMPEPSSPKNHKLLFVSFQSKVLVTLRYVPHNLPPKAMSVRSSLIGTSYIRLGPARGEIRRESSPSGRRPASPWGH